jgi:hypothetical protein
MANKARLDWIGVCGGCPRDVRGSDGSGGSDGSDEWWGVFAENRLAGAGALRQGLGVMLEKLKICDQLGQIEGRVRVGGGDAWRFIGDGMGLGGRRRAAVTEGRLASGVGGDASVCVQECSSR